MAGVAADRKGGRPSTQALPHRPRRLFGSDSTEPAPISCFDRVFFAWTGIRLDGKRSARFAQTGRM